VLQPDLALLCSFGLLILLIVMEIRWFLLRISRHICLVFRWKAAYFSSESGLFPRSFATGAACLLFQRDSIVRRGETILGNRFVWNRALPIQEQEWAGLLQSVMVICFEGASNVIFQLRKTSRPIRHE
jgi:hypothetical protein